MCTSCVYVACTLPVRLVGSSLTAVMDAGGIVMPPAFKPITDFIDSPAAPVSDSPPGSRADRDGDFSSGDDGCGGVGGGLRRSDEGSVSGPQSPLERSGSDSPSPDRGRQQHWRLHHDEAHLMRAEEMGAGGGGGAGGGSPLYPGHPLSPGGHIKNQSECYGQRPHYIQRTTTTACKQQPCHYTK